MSLRELKGRHLKLVSFYSSLYAVRGGTGLVFVVITLIFGLTVANFVIKPVEDLQRESQEHILEAIVSQARPLVVRALGGSVDASVPSEDGSREETERWAAFVLDERPALLSAVLLVLIFGLPFMVTMGAFNQLSGDVQSRGLRYQLVHTARANIFFGRFVGVAVINALGMVLLMGTIVLYVGFKIHVYEWTALLGWSLRGLLAIAVISLPYIALCSWISASIDSPFASLTVSQLVIGFVPLFSFIGRNTWKPLAYVNYALPWGIQNDLLHPDASRVTVGTLGCLAYTAAFLFLGYRHFKKRDL